MTKLDKLTYVKNAENVITSLERKKNGDFFLTTNQIRNLLSMTNELYLKIQHNTNEKLDEDVQSHVQYIKMKFAYCAGKNEEKIGRRTIYPVKELVEKAKLLEQFDQVGNSREYLMMLCHYMEALVAYHKYYS